MEIERPMYKLRFLIDYLAKVGSLSFTSSSFHSQSCLTSVRAVELEVVLCWDFPDKEFRHDKINNKSNVPVARLELEPGNSNSRG